MFRANNFDKLLDKATSNLRLDPDWPTILQICDLIRQNDCSPKYAVAAVKKKLYSQNPHQAMFALLTLESIVKNCGSGIHDEVTSKAFCEMLRDLVKSTQHENLRSKILELIQAWAFAFRNSPKYRAVQDTVNILKAEGFKFPALKESDAMFSADTAPEWADGEVCHRCRVAFSLMVRRHHCRACGQVFCQQCSSKTSTLPKFGIEKEVRVCDACFDKVSRPPSSTAKLEIVDTSNDYGPTQPQKRPAGGKTAEELQEEEELQLALALSQSEAEHKEKERKTRTHIAPEPTHHPTLSPSPSSVSASPEHAAGSELSRYLDRNYWEQRLSRDAAPPASAPAAASSVSSDPVDDFVKPTTSKNQEDDSEDKEIDDFVETLKSQVEIFVNRMKSNSSRGRSIANDTSVQTLFMNITAMHSRLLRYIQQQDDKRVYLESLQDKVTQVRDSRAALDTLRAEHAARLAQAAEHAERARQLQMAAKLQAMRKKKHEYLQYQRQLALQRVQEQEREMQMRQEQQKHQYMMSTNSGYYMPQHAAVTMPQYQPGYPAQPMYANPQFHPQMMQAGADGAQPQPPPAGAGPAFALSASAAALRPPAPSPLQQQMMLQQMHQMRLPMQPGVHQMMMPPAPAGPPAAAPQQNGQVPKTVPGPQPGPAGVPPLSAAQQGVAQSIMNSTALGMQMQNMRMSMMQGVQPGASQVPVSGYSMTLPNQPSQVASMQAPMANQPMSLPGQQMMQGQNPGMPNHIPPGQTGPPPNQLPPSQPQQQAQQGQVSQGQPVPMPSQSMQAPGQQMMMHGQQMVPQGQNIPQGQMSQMGQGQSMGHPQLQHPQMQQQMPIQQGQMPNQGAPLQQGQVNQNPVGHPGQAPQALPGGGAGPQPQGPAMPQQPGQPIKMQPQNFNGPPGQPPTNANQNSQPTQTNVKSEHNNNTAELISFD